MNKFDELVNDYTLIGDGGEVIFSSYDQFLEFVEEIRQIVDETAKGEHEPVAYLDEGLGAFYWPNEYKKDVGFTPLYAGPPHRWSNVTDDALMHEVRRRGFVIRDAQVGRKWAGLTKDEVDSWELPDSPTVFEFAQFIEAKLKEKNT